MNVIYNKFKSIEDIKLRGEYLKKGKIIPSRMVKCSKRKKQHCIKTGSNQWAIPTLTGYLVFVENNDGEFFSAVSIDNVSNANFNGSPYHLGGTYWQGNADIDSDEFLKIFNHEYLSRNNQLNNQ